MKLTVPQRLTSLFYNKKFSVIISIVLAFALWLGISMTANPTRERTFSDLSAVITLENTAASDGLGLGIISDVASQKFSVTVSGPNYVVSSLRADDFSLSASTIEINSPGEYTLKINAISNKQTGYTISSISPSTINIKVDTFDKKEFTLVPKLIGVSASEGLIADTPIVADSQKSSITIKGPVTTLERIASVGSLADVNDTLKASQTFSSDIVLYDKNDEILYRYTADGTVYDANNNVITNSYLTLSFTSVMVTQPIVKEKTVSCKATFINLPDGMTEKDVNYKLSQKKVTVIGTPEIVDKLDSVTLSPIDFREVSSSNGSFEVTPTLPDGVRIRENIESFTVDIDVSDYSEVVLDIKNIRTSGVDGNLKPSTAKSIRVTLCGLKSVISSVSASDFYALVDLTDKDAGSHNLEAIIKSDVYNNIWQIGSYTVSVKLS